MEAQGPIFDRSLETLGATDRGIGLFRKLLDAQIALVERGEDPTIAAVRDPEKNRIIEFEDMTQPWGSVELSFVR
jgi:5,5'-dehydrodivanillate O-demethylase